MLREVILLIFCPSRFVQFVTEQNIKKEFETNGQLKKSSYNGQLPPERYKAFEESALRSTNHIRHSLAVGFGLVLLAIGGGWGLGWVLGCSVGPAPKVLIIGLQLCAAGILLGATLSLVGWKIQTIGGQTLPEKINQYLYRAFYIIGTGILVVSLSWPQ